MSLKFTTTKSTVPFTLSTCALGLCALFAGCGTESKPITSQSTNYEVGETSASAETSQSSPPANVSDATPATGQVAPRRPAPINQTPVGDASAANMVQPTAEQVLYNIRRLRQQPLKEGNQDEVIAEFISVQSQVIQAADMLLEMNPGDDVVTEAAMAKIEALMGVSQVGARDAMDQLFAFTEELEKHPSEAVRAFARQQSFVTLLNAFSTDQVTDAQLVIDAFKKLADEQPKEGGLLTFGRDVSSRFVEKGMAKEAADLLRYTAGLVTPTEDPRLQAAADGLIEQAKFAEVDLGAKLQAVAEKEEGAIEEFATTLGELTAGEQVGPTTLRTLATLTK